MSSLSLTSGPGLTSRADLNAKAALRSNALGGQLCDSATQVCRNKRPLLRIVKPESARFVWLNKGRAGNLQTAAEMAALVREAAWRDIGLKDLAAKILISNGLDSHSQPNAILDALLRFTQQQVSYIADAGGEFDDIASARETLVRHYGDCDDLSVLLATLVMTLGFNPSFVMTRYRGNGNGFDHIYVEVPTKVGVIPLDPTSRKHGAGWENPRAIERVVFPISGNASGFTGLGSSFGFALVPPVGGAAGGGLMAALGPIGAVAGIAATLVSLIANLFHHGLTAQQRQIEDVWNQTVAQAMQVFAALAAQRSISQSDYDAAANTVSSLDQFVAQNASADKDRIKNQWYNDANYRAAFVSQLATLRSKVAAGNLGQGTAAAGSDLSGTTGGLSVSLPVLLLIAAGVYFLAHK